MYLNPWSLEFQESPLREPRGKAAVQGTRRVGSGDSPGPVPSKPQDFMDSPSPNLSLSALPGGTEGGGAQCRNLLPSAAAGAINRKHWDPGQPQMSSLSLRHPVHRIRLKLATWLNNGNEVDQQIYLGFSLASQGKEAFHCPHI